MTVKLCKESETVPSVCYEYVLSPLVNKEASLAYGIAEYSQAGRDINRESRQSQREAM